MQKSIVGAALGAALLLFGLAPDTQAQDPTGTWFKARLSARVLIDDVGGDPTFEFQPKPKRMNIKSTFYFQIDGLDEGDLELVIWTMTDEGLVMAEGIDQINLAANGVSRGFSFEVPVVKKVKGSYVNQGLIEAFGSGQLRTKFTKDGEIKSLSFRSLGGRAYQEDYVDGKFDVHGGASVKARSIKETKLPPFAEVMVK